MKKSTDEDPREEEKASLLESSYPIAFSLPSS